MTNLRILPQKAALVMAIMAFGVVWGAGLLWHVPGYAIAWRSVLAAGVFWAVGLVMGRVFVNGLTEAISEHLRREEECVSTETKSR